MDIGAKIVIAKPNILVRQSFFYQGNKTDLTVFCSGRQLFTQTFCALTTVFIGQPKVDSYRIK